MVSKSEKGRKKLITIESKKLVLFIRFYLAIYDLIYANFVSNIRLSDCDSVYYNEKKFKLSCMNTLE